MLLNLINLSKIKEEAYNYLISLCDKVEFLYVNYNEGSNFKFDILESGYDDLLNQYLYIKNGESWGMSGEKVTFLLSSNIIGLIKEIGLNGYLKITENSTIENITLYKNEKVVFSICSHEGIEYFEEEFEEQVKAFCLEKIAKTEIYLELCNNIKTIKDKKVDEIYNDILVLEDLVAFVEQDWNKIIRQTPKTLTTFDEYKKLAEKYLSKNTYDKIKKFKSFKDFYSSGYPTNFDEIIKFGNNEKFSESEIFKIIMEEVFLINIILVYKFGFKNNEMNGNNKISFMLNI